MKKWLRRLRGALGLGFTWGLAWFAAGMVLLLIVGPDAADVPFPLGFGLLGFLAGVTFSGILGLVAGRRRFEEFSIPQFAGWGGAGGVLFAALFTTVTQLGLDVFAVLGPVFGGAGALCAAGTLALARRAEGGGQLEDGVDLDRIGLTDEESRELLGDGR